MIAANGNDPKLGDETIFAWKPGQPTARIVHTKAALIAMASAAVQQNLSSIVDVTGIALDPANPGEMLFTTGSSSRALGGKVFTTAGGGAIASMNNAPLDAQNAWGLDAQPVLDALEIYAQSKDAVGIRADVDRIVTPAATPLTVDCYGAAPGGTVQLFVSHARFPVQTPFAMPVGIGGLPFAFLTPGDPLFAQSANIPILRVPISITGVGAARIPVGQVPPGTSIILQGLDLTTLEATTPIAIDFTAS